jgi:hypothetical protein
MDYRTYQNKQRPPYRTAHLVTLWVLVTRRQPHFLMKIITKTFFAFHAIIDFRFNWLRMQIQCLRSIGLWRWHINIVIAILDIIHNPFFYLKICCFGDWNLSPSSRGAYSDGHNRKASLCLRTSFYWAHLCTFHLKTETESSIRNVDFLIKERTVDNVENYDSYESSKSILEALHYNTTENHNFPVDKCIDIGTNGRRK